MAVQDTPAKIGFFEDFQTLIEDTAITIADADGLRLNDIQIVALSGDVDALSTVDESNGVWSFNGAGAAADGVALLGSPMRPDRNGTIVVGGRAKCGSASDFRFFAGLMSTADKDETVNPFTLSGTTLTANNAGEAVGWYFDSGATTDLMRFMSSTAGAADTTASVFNHQTGVQTTLGSLGIGATAMTLTADKYFVWKIEMDNDGAVRAYIGDETMGVKGLKLIATLAKGTMAPTSLYFPTMILAANSTGDGINEVDYFYANGNRYWGA
jgi:hypothetical protein